MAASITIGSVAVAADGKTVTATISGGTGTGYAITDKTGLSLTVTVGGNPIGFPVSGVSVSGSTLTFTLYLPTGSGETLKMALATNSNLTDSGANTPTGQTNLAVTNSSAVAVTTYDLNSGVIESGYFTTTTNPARSGTVFVDGVADYWAEWVSDGTEYGLLSYSAVTSTARIDGGTATTVPADANSFYNVKPITTTPLAAGKHLIQVNTDYFFGVRVSGGTRTMYSVPTTKRTVLANATAYLSGIPNSTPIQVYGAYTANATTGVATTGGSYVGMEIDCQIGGTGLEVLTLVHQSNYWSCEVDGAYAGAIIKAGDPSLTNTGGWARLAAGLAPGTHTIHATLLQVGANTSHRAVRVLNGAKTTAASAVSDTTLTVNDTTYLAVGDWVRIDNYSQRECRQIQSISGLTVTFNAAFAKTHAIGAQVTSYSAPAGTITNWTKKDKTARRIVAMGDSNTQGANQYGFASTPDPNGVYYVPYDPRTPMAYQLAQTLSMELVNVGIQGTDTANQAGRAADIGTYGRQSYDYVLIWEGTNDMNANTITPATYGANVQTQITAAKPYLRANGKIILIPPGTPPGKTNSQGLNIAACASQLATLAAADPANVLFASGVLSNLVAADYDGGITTSTLHYTPSGQAKIAANLVPFLSGLLGGTGMFFAA